MNKLNEVIKERGLKKKWVAEQAHISPSTLSNLLKGGEPEIKTALRLAKVLGKSVEELWGHLKEE